MNLADRLVPGTELHSKLTKLIRSRLDMSYRTISQNFNLWDTLEESYRAYIPMDQEDRESFKKNKVQKIIVPIQFATVQTMLTFMMEVFTAVKPVLRVRGADPSSRRKANVMEVALDYDYRGNHGYFQLQQWMLNAFRYGYGVLENTWGTRTVTRQMMRPAPSQVFTFEDQEIQAPGAMELVKDYFTIFEGNKWQVLDNRCFFYDPRYPLSRFQEGEFCGVRDMIHDNELHKLEKRGLYFNTDLIRTDARMGQTRDSEQNSFNDNSRSRLSPEAAFQVEMREARKMRMHVKEDFIVELVPRHWHLDESDEPEHWVMTLINGTNIVRCEPSEAIGPFPYSIIEPYPDVLASLSQGVMELTQPLVQHLNFLFNSHMANVRKALNDMFIVDPSRVDVRDLLDPRAGKIIRLLPTAYGLNPDMFIKQLAVNDITRTHIEDSKVILDLWNRILGLGDHMFGQIAPSKRTASELQGVFKMAGTRMKMVADLFSSEGIAPLTEQMAFLRQQEMSETQFFEIAGKTAIDYGVSKEDIIDDAFIKVQRDHLVGNYHFPAEEGVLPQDRAQAAEILKGAFETVAKAPFLAMAFDPVELFRESVRQFGIHHIDDFLNQKLRANVQIVDSPIFQQMMMKKNMRPLRGGNGGRPDQGVRENAEGQNFDGFVNGSGRTQS
jgi:hypothetical protein